MPQLQSLACLLGHKSRLSNRLKRTNVFHVKAAKAVGMYFHAAVKSQHGSDYHKVKEHTIIKTADVRINGVGGGAELIRSCGSL